MKSVETYVWVPTWCILSAGTVLRLHRHELGDLTTGKRQSGQPDMLRVGSGRTYCCNCLRSSLSLPTSCNRMRTSPARALLKSLMYLIDHRDLSQIGAD